MTDEPKYELVNKNRAEECLQNMENFYNETQKYLLEDIISFNIDSANLTHIDADRPIKESRQSFDNIYKSNGFQEFIYFRDPENDYRIYPTPLNEFEDEEINTAEEKAGLNIRFVKNGIDISYSNYEDLFERLKKLKNFKNKIIFLSENIGLANIELHDRLSATCLLLFLFGFFPNVGFPRQLERDRQNIYISRDLADEGDLLSKWAEKQEEYVGIYYSGFNLNELINRENFMKWAVEKGFIKEVVDDEKDNIEKANNKAKERKKDRIEKIKNILLEKLPNHTGKKFSIRGVAQRKTYFSEIAASEELLRKDIADIVKSDWWEKQDKETIQSKINLINKKNNK